MLVEVAVLVLYGAHAGVQLLQEILPVIADSKVEVRGAYLTYRDQIFRVAESVRSDVRIEFSVLEHFQSFAFLSRKLYKLRIYSLLLCPFAVKAGLYASLVYSYLFPVQGRIVVCPDIRIAGRSEDIVLLGVHAQRREEHLC